MSRPDQMDTVPVAHAVTEGNKVLIFEGSPRRGRGSLLWRDSSPHFDRTRPLVTATSSPGTAERSQATQQPSVRVSWHVTPASSTAIMTMARRWQLVATVLAAGWVATLLAWAITP